MGILFWTKCIDTLLFVKHNQTFARFFLIFIYRFNLSTGSKNCFSGHYYMFKVFYTLKVSRIDCILVLNFITTVFPRLFFFEFNLMYCDLWTQYIQVRKIFKGGNYSRAETIRGNLVFEFV